MSADDARQKDGTSFMAGDYERRGAFRCTFGP